MILYTNIEIKIPQFPRRIISSWIKNVSMTFQKEVGEIAYIFCTDTKIKKLNKTYLSHNYYTDVITFDYSNNEIISGDIFISIETVKSNAEKYQVTFKQELFRVMIHGILHLCGLNDQTEKENEIMKIFETNALIVLKNNYNYNEF